MGPSYVDAYVPLVILVAATLVGVMQTPSTAYLYAVARHKVWAGLNGFDAMANLGLSLLLAPRFGMIGVALGTMIPAFFVKLFLQPKYICGQLGLPLLDYWSELGAVFLRTVALQVPIAAVIWMIHPVSLVSIIGLAVPLYFAHALALYLFALNDQDQSALAKALPVLDSLLTIRRRVAALVTRSAS
jgi:O-antigen/teichoic acid export membrane protein